MEWFLIWALCAIFSAAIASSKHRSSGGWFVLGFLFGPFALISVGLMPTLRSGSEARTEPNQNELRKCPQCAEMIKREAKKCRYCGSEVEPIAPWDGVDRTSAAYQAGRSFAGLVDAQIDKSAPDAAGKPLADLDRAVRDAYRPKNLLLWLLGAGAAIYVIYWVSAFVTNNLHP